MKKLAIFVLVVALVLSLAACSTTSAESSEATESEAASEVASSEEASSSEAASTSKSEMVGNTPRVTQDPNGKTGLVFGVSMADMDMTFFQAAIYGMDEAAADLGITLEYRNCNNDAVLQNSQIEELVAMDVDAVLCVYADQEAIMEGVKACNEADVPFVYVDRDMASTEEAAPDWGTGTDEHELATSAWEWMIDWAKENDTQLKVLEVAGNLNDKNVVVRSEVTQEIMEEYPEQVELVAQVLSEWDNEKALAGTVNALQAHPEINCIFMHYDGLADPIFSALKQADRWKKVGEEGHVMIIPYSGHPTSVEAMEDGYLDMIAGMNIIGYSYEAVVGAYELVNGKDPGDFLTDPGFIIDQENMDEMLPKTYGWAELQGYLG